MGTKASYRNNPETRQRAIERAKQYQQRAEGQRKLRIYWSGRVYNTRVSIELYLNKIAVLERRLFHEVKMLERAKLAVKK